MLSAHCRALHVDHVQRLDKSRLVNPASGWYDAPVGDVIDVHDYVEVRSPRPTWARAAVLGEYGGLGHKVGPPCAYMGWLAKSSSSLQDTLHDAYDYGSMHRKRGNDGSGAACHCYCCLLAGHGVAHWHGL